MINVNYQETIKNDLLLLDVNRFYLKYIIKSHNWYFSEYLKVPDAELIDKMDLFKEIVTQNFHVSFHSVQIVGSAKMGVSLSPKKLLKPFHSESSDEKSSDIDIAIVSEKLFNLFWDKLRHSKEKIYYKRNYNNIANSIYRGYINDKDLDKINDIKQYLRELTNPATFRLQDEIGFVHPISYRVYRSWEDLEDYQLIGINKAKVKLEEQQNV